MKLELGVLVLAYNLLRYVIARGQAPGKRRGIASTAAAAISFISTIPILYAARRSLVKAFAMLVAAVAADSLERRKRKNYVRAVKRRPKPYPLLTKPRSEYRPIAAASQRRNVRAFNVTGLLIMSSHCFFAHIIQQPNGWRNTPKTIQNIQINKAARPPNALVPL